MKDIADDKMHWSKRKKCPNCNTIGKEERIGIIFEAIVDLLCLSSPRLSHCFHILSFVVRKRV